MPLLNRPVLVLNQSYDPSRCVVRVGLSFLCFAAVPRSSKRWTCTSARFQTGFRSPSVVRLGIYVRVAPRQLALSKKNVLKRDGHRCQYCGTRKGPMTVDHVVPRTGNGRDTWENLVCACLPCNNLKGNQTPEQAGINLLRRPRRPGTVTSISQLIGVPDSRWRPYLFMD